MRTFPCLVALCCALAPASGAPSLAERFPTLPRQLAANRESFTDHLLASRRLEDYCTEGGPELWKGLELLLMEKAYSSPPTERNYALTLLLWLLSQAAYTRGDPITVALALANASLYALGDGEVRAAIRRDVVAHYQLYRSVAEWQEGWAIAYRLSGSPLVAKVLWCYRANQLELDGKSLTLEEYRTFVDRVDMLEDMSAWARAHDVSEATSLRGIVLNVDALFRSAYHYAHFMAMIRQWYVPLSTLPESASDDELYVYLSSPEVVVTLPDWAREVLEDYRDGSYYVDVLGRRRDPQARMWVNYQWQLYRDSGSFRGDCGTEAEVCMALWKAAGLVAIAIYHTGKDMGHAYAMYYDPFVGRFRTLQDLSSMVEKHGAGAAVTLHPMPLRLQEKAPLARPQPRTTVARYTRFVGRGMELAALEAMYLKPGEGDLPEVVFSPSRCPVTLPDSDGDGLGDADELSFGTSAAEPDTDRDGFADAWERERGFDPREASSPATADLGGVLVGHVVEVSSARYGLTLGAALDGTGLYRIVRSDEAQYYFIVAAGTGMCVGVGDQGRIVEAPFAGTRAQKWKLLFREEGTFVLQSRADGGVMVLLDGQDLVARSPRGTRDEVWVIR